MASSRRSVIGVVCAVLVVAVSVPAKAQDDHLKCYKTKDSIAVTGTADLNTSEFGLDPGCKVSKAKFFCVPGTKTNVNVKNKRTNSPITPLPVSGRDPGDRVCYKVKCPTPVVPIADRVITDQFGTRTMAKFKASYLCTPAVKGTAFCGDATIGAAEQCDGANLNGATCRSLGFTGGTLGCTPGCSFDTSNCTGVPCTGAFPASGQITCWADGGGALMPCAGTGQDGELKAGRTLSYTDNGDGTITDDNTRLMWEKQSEDGSIHDIGSTYTWPDAVSVHVAALNTASFAGYTDWRLPNVKELVSIVNYENMHPVVSPAFNSGCTTGCTVLTCSCVAFGSSSGATYYWSSTSLAQSGFEANAWIVDFTDGVVNGGAKTSAQFRVRAVRGG